MVLFFNKERCFKFRDFVKKMNQKQVANNLFEFFKQTNHFMVLYNIQKRGVKISIRLIEFLLATYSVLNPVSYILAYKENEKGKVIDYNDPGQEGKKALYTSEKYKIKHFHLRTQYEQQMEIWHKINFDPCCRAPEDQKYIMQNNKMVLKTAIKQLIFFKWAIENGVLIWLDAHYQEVHHAMQIEEGIKKKNNTAAKRKQSMDPNFQFSSRSDTLKRKKKKLSTIPNNDSLLLFNHIETWSAAKC